MATSNRTVVAAQEGDRAAFEQLMAAHRRELVAHCYRMLGSLDDAEDALQETMLSAWRGLDGLQQPDAVRAWLYRIATNHCLRLARRRPRRVLSWDLGPARDPGRDLGEPVTGGAFLDPWPGTGVGAGMDREAPKASSIMKESVELAYVAALQHLPARQRAVLILREVLNFSAADVADMLETSTASVNSALQRARASVADRHPDRSQQAEQLTAAERRVVDVFVDAWEHADVPAIVALLAEDVRFTMPPLPAWYDGRADVAAFMAQRLFATPWRLVALRVNAQPAFACYQGVDGTFRLGAVNVLSFRDGRIDWIAAFLGPDTLARFELPEQL